MSDISLCNNVECKAFEQCHRNSNYHQKGLWQSYLLHTTPMEKCELFWQYRPDNNDKVVKEHN